MTHIQPGGMTKHFFLPPPHFSFSLCHDISIPHPLSIFVKLLCHFSFSICPIFYFYSTSPCQIPPFSLVSFSSLSSTSSPPQIYLRFLDYEMQNSNECKRNFVAVYDGSASVEDLKNKFCSTVANDVMLVSTTGVIRMWADQGSRRSRFRILFTTFQERKTVDGVHVHSYPGSVWADWKYTDTCC